jgi:hypothetical protein
MHVIPAIEVTWWTEIRRYIRADDDVDISGTDYIAVPELDFDFPMMQGGIKDNPVFIKVPADLDPFHKMIVQTHAPVEVKILEIDPANDETRIAYIGRVAATTARYQGQTRLIRVELWGRKAFLKDATIGIKTGSDCVWKFGDVRTCGKDPVPSVTAYVTNITKGTLLHFNDADLPPMQTPPALPGGNTAGWGPGVYTRGKVVFEGLSISIRQHKRDPTHARLVMAKPPPQDAGIDHTWLGKEVQVFQGCDRSRDACEFHGRQESWMGIGLLQPKHNPIIENRPEG